MSKSVQVLVEGKVQGVWYRGWTEKTARELHLSGWVRNLEDGRVEAIFTGDETDVDKMVELCWQGPEPAIVTAVSVSDAKADESGEFVVRSTK